MGGWICLMYHDVARGSTGPSSSAKHFSVGQADFCRQLDAIVDAGFRVCAVEDIRPESTAAIAVSFDDGTAGQYERAFPALAERGMSASFYVVTSWVGGPGFISWEGLREMKAAGMSIQSHTHTHPFLSELGRAELVAECRRSKDELDARLEQNTSTIALPGGDLPARGLRAILRESGYVTVATSRWGINRGQATSVDGIRYVRRCTVRGRLAEMDFRRIIRGDRLMWARRAVREGALGGIRQALGPSRYALWRGRLFRAMYGD